MRDSTGRSRCFAFLTFDDPASVNAVMVREHFLDGKIVCWVYCARQNYLNINELFVRSILSELFRARNINALRNFS